MLRRRLNQYAVAALTALAACGAYVLITALTSHVSLGLADRPAGFVSSVLFLVPGFPLVAALLDLLEHQTAAAVMRFAYGIMIFMAAMFGVSIVVGIVGADLSPQPAAEMSYPLNLLLRAIASFVGGCGFAMLFNSPVPVVVAVGLLAMGANELRLVLHDMGMMIAPATFFGALAVGFAASIMGPRLDVPYIILTVPGIIVMVPGLYAFQTIVWLNRGQMLDALQTAASCGFIVGAMTMGLAAPRFLDRTR
jgi:uncharacterized membrane protein YjjB (DUF3815 family)